MHRRLLPTYADPAAAVFDQRVALHVAAVIGLVAGTLAITALVIGCTTDGPRKQAHATDGYWKK